MKTKQQAPRIMFTAARVEVLQELSDSRSLYAFCAPHIHRPECVYCILSCLIFFEKYVRLYHDVLFGLLARLRRPIPLHHVTDAPQDPPG
jgi:hypothetical protein